MLDFGQGAAGPSGWPDFSCTQDMCIMALHRLQGGRVHGDRYGKMVRPDEGLWLHHPGRGGKDAFVHKSAVERAGISGLDEGQRVEYELQPGRDGKSAAENLKHRVRRKPLVDKIFAPLASAGGASI